MVCYENKRCLKVKNYYELIGVARTATTTEIKARYRALSKSYHPDAGGSEQHMAQLNEAYRILMSPLERAAYDRSLRREQDAARAAAVRRQRAAQEAHAKTTAQHKAARAYAMQQKDIFEQTNVQKPGKKSAFWKFMGWSTAAYVIVGLAIVYALTMPTTASPDTATDAPNTTSLAQEAAQASASLPETPATVTQTAPPVDDTPPENSTPDATASHSNAPTTDQSAPQPCDDNTHNSSSCEQTGSNENKPDHRPDWRKFFRLN